MHLNMYQQVYSIGEVPPSPVPPMTPGNITTGSDSSPATGDDFKYAGCYEDAKHARILAADTTTSDTMTAMVSFSLFMWSR